MEEPDPAVPFARVLIEDDDWLRENFSVTRLDDDALLIEGTCRRCGHRVTTRIERRTVRSFQSNAAKPRPMLCECGEEHAGRDAGYGCGAYWGLALRPRG
jgi:hypothetical protein